MTNKTRLYLYNRHTKKDTVTYLDTSVLSALNSDLSSFQDLLEYLPQQQAFNALNRLGGDLEHAPNIEATLQHHTLIQNWRELR